jgi:phenylpyruvate tautomerase PptA (4-oxalocrotonate tautomerase family)
MPVKINETNTKPSQSDELVKRVTERVWQLLREEARRERERRPSNKRK